MRPLPAPIVGIERKSWLKLLGVTFQENPCCWDLHIDDLLSKASGRMHGRTGREKLGGPKEICPTFSDCARPVPKKLFVEQINFGEKFRSVYHFRGPKIFPDLQNFSDHQTPFPYITKFTTKFT
jgi:hypothetical protein